MTRYELEPTIKDVFVEGPSDRSIMEEFFRTSGVADVETYEIDTVEVPDDLLVALGLPDNNRSKVIALGCTLGDSVRIDLLRRVVCVADADFAFFLAGDPACDLVIYTDFTSLDLYLLNGRVLSKALTVLFLGFPVAAEEVIRQLVPALTEVFLFRLANQVLGWGLPALPVTRCCKLDGHQIAFDADEYLNRYLNGGGRLADEAQFVTTVEVFREKFYAEWRRQVRGKDFMELFKWYLFSIKPPKSAVDPRFFQRSVYACLDFAELGQADLFKELVRRLT